MFDRSAIRALTFDCYGTLIDWQTGLLRAIRPAFELARAPLESEQVLRAFAQAERRAEEGPYRSYKAVLEDVARELLGPHCDEQTLWRSIADWPAFDDTAPALQRLQKRFKLAVLSNIDNDLFEASHQRLGVTLDLVVTAQRVRSYKPGLAHFRTALTELGLATTQALHIAESRFHDIQPANRMGIPCIWINRTGQGPSASGDGAGTPDVTLKNLSELAATLLD